MKRKKPNRDSFSFSAFSYRIRQRGEIARKALSMSGNWWACQQGGRGGGGGSPGVKGAWRWNCPEQRHIEACVGFDTSINLPKRDFNDRRNRCALWGFLWPQRVAVCGRCGRVYCRQRRQDIRDKHNSSRRSKHHVSISSHSTDRQC